GTSSDTPLRIGLSATVAWTLVISSIRLFIHRKFNHGVRIGGKCRLSGLEPIHESGVREPSCILALKNGRGFFERVLRRSGHDSGRRCNCPIPSWFACRNSFL